jgi:hypothetical protein
VVTPAVDVVVVTVLPAEAAAAAANPALLVTVWVMIIGE